MRAACEGAVVRDLARCGPAESGSEGRDTSALRVIRTTCQADSGPACYRDSGSSCRDVGAAVPALRPRCIIARASWRAESVSGLVM